MNKKIALFLIILGITCPICYYIVIKYLGSTKSGSIFVLALMWLPAMAAFISKLVFDHNIKNIGWKIRGFRYIGVAYIVPLIICIIVYGFAWLTGIGTCKPFPIINIISLATFGVLISMISALGEEIGWRGFLLTELRKNCSYLKLNLIIGIIWFFYHVPLMVFSDYNNGNIPASLICFFITAISATVIATTLCIKAESMWPSVMFHASHNLFVQSVFDQMTVNKAYTQYITSEFGIGLTIGYLIVALSFAYFYLKKEGKVCKQANV